MARTPEVRSRPARSRVPGLRRLARQGLLAGLFAILAAGRPGAAESGPAVPPGTEVDLALVIAVDVSYSMDTEEQALQREGFAGAFRAPAVVDAIRRGLNGRIAVTYVEWAGATDQTIVVPWTVLDDPETIHAFADQIAQRPMRRAMRTSISGALDFSVRLLAESGVEATRRVIDVSGDGPNNQGRPVTLAREAALAAGITVNGLPIMLKAPGYFDIPDLDAYYRDCVIGGRGAFMVPARERDQFGEAIRTKILLEVAGREPEPRVQFAQGAPRADCMAGENLWNDRMRN